MKNNFKKLVYIAKSHIPSRWANSIQVANMTIALSYFFDETELLVPYKFKRVVYNILSSSFKPYGLDNINNVIIKYLKRKNKKEYGFEENVFHLLKKHYLMRDDILYFTRSIVVANFLLKNNQPFIFESHEFEKDCLNNFFQDFIIGVNDSKIARIITISNYIKSKYIEVGLSENRVNIFYDAVNVELFKKHKNINLETFFPNIKLSRKKIIYTGSLKEEKGAIFLCRTAKFLPKYDIVIFGGEEKEVDKLKRKYPFPNLYISPFVENFLIPGILKNADILALPYLKTGDFISGMSPLKLYEYLLSEKIVIASNIEVLKEVITDKENCIMFEPNNIDDFISKINIIEELALNEKQHIIKNGLEIALLNSWNNRAKNILKWYLTVMEMNEC